MSGRPIHLVTLVRHLLQKNGGEGGGGVVGMDDTAVCDATHSWFELSRPKCRQKKTRPESSMLTRTAALVGVPIGDPVSGVSLGAQRDPDDGAVQGVRVLPLQGVVQLVPAVSHGPEQLVGGGWLRCLLPTTRRRTSVGCEGGSRWCEIKRGYIISSFFRLLLQALVYLGVSGEVISGEVG